MGRGGVEVGVRDRVKVRIGVLKFLIITLEPNVGYTKFPDFYSLS